MTTYWLAPSNPEKFDVRGALRKFGGYIDWTKKRDIKNSDIVYLYESNTTKGIIAKFIVINNEITDETRFKDEQFWKSEVKINSKGYFRMQLLRYFEQPLSIQWLKENGLKSNIQSVEKMKVELLEKIRLKEFSNKIVGFPDLVNSIRDREYSQYTQSSISKIIQSYLFDGKSHRQIDEEILNLDSKKSKGYQAMGVLHYLGLVAGHKGIFKGLNMDEGVFVLEKVEAIEVLNHLRSSDFDSDRKEIELKKEFETIIKAKEGKKIEIYTYKYERNSKLREEAIKLHGHICAACGFNFEKQYGEIGKDFIEVHHIKPLHFYNEEVEINPLTDLLPVCANCHRMIHRKRDEVLSVEELQNIIKRAK